MTVVTLMRHARQRLPDGPGAGRLFSVGDRELGKEGVEQAERARDLLAGEDFDAVVSSPLERSRHTAEIVAGPHDLPVQEVRDLAEVPFANLGSEASYEEVLDRIGEIARALYRGEDPQLATGERWSDVADRALGALEEVREAHERPLVVAHGGVNRIILADALDLDPHQVFDLEQDHACVNVLDYRENRTVVRLVNGVAGRLPRAQS